MERSSGTTSPTGRATARVVVAVAVIAFAAQCVLSMRLKSVTYDEPAYISAGYAYLTEGRFTLNPEHPPLMKYIAALPLLFLDGTPAREISHWDEAPGRPLDYGHDFLFSNRLDADTLLLAARLPIVLCGVALLLLVYTWANDAYGPTGGMAAAVLCAFSPNLLAHSRLATLDLGATLFVFASCYAYWRLYRRPRWQSAVLCGVVLAAAALAKHTAGVLVAVLPFYFGAAVIDHRRRRMGDDALTAGDAATNHPCVRRLIATSLLSVIVFFALVAVAYGPSHFGWRRYLDGFKQLVWHRDQLVNMEWPSFCWGRYSTEGFRWYYLAALLIKTPLPLLILLIGAIVRFAVRRQPPRTVEFLLALPVVLFLLAAVPVRPNIGLRQVLPIYPFLFVLVGGAMAALVRSRRGRLGLTALGIWYVGGALWIYPDHLSYFNELIGGPRRGIYYLDDSNIDWGQGLKQLAAYQRERGIEELTLMYYGPGDPGYYGLSYRDMTTGEITNPRPGWYAIPAHLLQRPDFTDGLKIRFDWLDRFEPQALVGRCIFVYRFE